MMLDGDDSGLWAMQTLRAEIRKCSTEKVEVSYSPLSMLLHQHSDARVMNDDLVAALYEIRAGLSWTEYPKLVDEVLAGYDITLAER